MNCFVRLLSGTREGVFVDTLLDICATELVVKSHVMWKNERYARSVPDAANETELVPLNTRILLK